MASFWNKNPILHKLAKNFGYLFSSNMIGAGLSMLQGIFSARMLGVSGLGTLGTITVFVTVINKITSFRMGELVIKYVGEFNENSDPTRAAAVFKAAALTELIASVLAFGLVWLLAPVGALYFAKDASLAPWFVVYGYIILANLIAESSTGLLQLFDRFRRMAGLNILQSVVTLALIILAWWLKAGLLGVLVAYLCGKVICPALGKRLVESPAQFVETACRRTGEICGKHQLERIAQPDQPGQRHPVGFLFFVPAAGRLLQAWHGAGQLHPDPHGSHAAGHLSRNGPGRGPQKME
jgi:hypothetical protein